MLRRRILLKDGLPNGYKKLEFIRNASTAYIDVGIQPKYTFDYEIKARAFTGNVVMGMTYKGDSKSFRFFTIPNPYYLDVGNKRIILRNSHSATKPYHVAFGNYYLKDLDENTEVKGDTFDEKMNGTLFSSNLYLLYGYGNVQGYVYLFKIWDNGKLIRNFVPCRHISDNKVGLYDLVEGKFYISPNGVEFIGSDEVSTTEELLEGEIIEDDSV